MGSAYAALTPEMLKKSSPSPADDMLKTFDSSILALAKQQRMASDLSTAIFCIIVTGEVIYTLSLSLSLSLSLLC